MTEREYNDCVTQHADAVYRFVLKTTRHPQDAQDIVQTAFEAFWINRQQVQAETAKSFLYKIAYHKMIDHHRKNRRVELHDGEAPFDSPVSPEQHHIRATLNRALDTLSEQNRSLVLLKDYEGYSYEEIGQITGLNASQVKVYLHRSRLQLRNYIVKMENVL